MAVILSQDNEESLPSIRQEKQPATAEEVQRTIEEENHDSAPPTESDMQERQQSPDITITVQDENQNIVTNTSYNILTHPSNQNSDQVEENGEEIEHKESKEENADNLISVNKLLPKSSPKPKKKKEETRKRTSSRSSMLRKSRNEELRPSVTSEESINTVPQAEEESKVNQEDEDVGKNGVAEEAQTVSSEDVSSLEEECEKQVLNDTLVVDENSNKTQSEMVEEEDKDKKPQLVDRNNSPENNNDVDEPIQLIKEEVTTADSDVEVKVENEDDGNNDANEEETHNDSKRSAFQNDTNEEEENEENKYSASGKSSEYDDTNSIVTSGTTETFYSVTEDDTATETDDDYDIIADDCLTDSLNPDSAIKLQFGEKCTFVFKPDWTKNREYISVMHSNAATSEPNVSAEWM